jgi:hypothetical protein
MGFFTGSGGTTVALDQTARAAIRQIAKSAPTTAFFMVYSSVFFVSLPWGCVPIADVRVFGG